MILSQHDIESADISFDPPMTKMAKSRKVYLSTASGVLLAGIKYSKAKGWTVPKVLTVINKPEYGEGAEPLEQAISDLTREVLRGRAQEALQHAR